MHKLFEILNMSAGIETDLISLEDLKLELGITGTSQDHVYAQRIERQSLLIASYLDRVPLALVTVQETFIFNVYDCCEDRWSCEQPLVLRQYPVVAIDSVTIDDVEITDYEVNHEKGLLYRTDGSWFWGGRVVVIYSGGYSLPDEAPAALQAAVIEAVRQRTAFSTADPTIRSTQHGDTRVDYYSAPMQSSSGLPAAVTSAINQYRRVAI